MLENITSPFQKLADQDVLLIFLLLGQQELEAFQGGCFIGIDLLSQSTTQLLPGLRRIKKKGDGGGG